MMTLIEAVRFLVACDGTFNGQECLIRRDGDPWIMRLDPDEHGRLISGKYRGPQHSEAMYLAVEDIVATDWEVVTWDDLPDQGRR